MKVLNNKVFVKRLPDSEQPVKTFLNPNADAIKLAEVLEVGSKVDRNIKKGDIVTLYISDLYSIPGFDFETCSDRSILFVNEYPDSGKIHISNPKTEPLNMMISANVLKSSSYDIEDGDTIYYRKGQGLILPDNTEIISETQVFYSKR